jgi:hypothetical protein
MAKTATATRNRPKSANVSKTAIDQLGSLLQDLSEKPKAEMSLREAINELREPIQSAMAKGYNYEDIVKILAEEGIPTTVTTVKRYISLGNPPRRKSSGKTRAKRGRTASTSEADAESPAPRTRRSTKAAESVDAEAPKPRGRRKTAAASAEPPAQTKIKTEPKSKAKGTRAASRTAKSPARGRKASS